jgi:GxxExxY protein
MRNDLFEGALTESIIGAFYEVYNELGFGFREKLHCKALALELSDRGHSVGREVDVPVRYKRHELGFQRIDMIVDGLVVVEIKSSAILPPTASQQLFNYLRATDLDVGLLLHFGEKPAFCRKVSPRRKRSFQPKAVLPAALTDSPDETDKI